jgi:rSAM/selenodomain-associated transferase 2
MKISIIIPTLNEEKTIGRTLEHLVEQGAREILVVDGGSVDRTVEIAQQHTHVIPSMKGRARQMNVGAEHATGSAFLFLHSDTLLPTQGLEQISKTLIRGYEAGRFRMKFDDSRWLLKLYAVYTRFQIFSYGDQGFFVTKRLFSLLGGFNEQVPFEDIDFYKRLRTVTKPVILKKKVTTSARRFVMSGSFSQKLINIWLVGLYYLGFNVDAWKQRFYPEIR